MGDVDMFATQTQDGQDADADDMYISLATEVTIRKCKIVQRKEKLKLIDENIQKLCEKLKLATKEARDIAKAKEDVCQQKNVRVESLKGDDETCASMERMLCELDSKLLWKRAETKKLSDGYKADMQKSLETWKSYEKIYKEFPMAKKLQEVTTERKNVDIEIRKSLVDIQDMKDKMKLKDEIRAKKLHNWGVNLAKLYFELQEKIAENNTLQKKIRETRKLIEDAKAGKLASQQSPIQNTSCSINMQETQKDNPLKTLQFNWPVIRANSPPRPSDQSQPSSSSFRNILSLESLLQSCGIYSRRQDTANKTTDHALAINTVTQSVTSNKPLTNPQKVKPCANKENTDAKRVPIKSNFKLNSALSSIKNKNENRMENKLKSNFDNKLVRVENQYTGHKEPPKKVMVVEDLRKQSVSVISTDNNEPISNNFNQEKDVVIEKKMSSVNQLKKKNVVQLNCDLRSFPGIKEYRSSLTTDQNRTTNNNVSDRPLEIPITQNAQSIPNVMDLPGPSASQPSSKPNENYQSNSQHSQQKPITQSDMFAEEEPENQPESMMDVNTPPDIVPVENNSQPLSQNASSKCSSQSLSDYISPELNESAKLAYQRLAAESPGYVYSRGPDVMCLQTSGVQMSAPVRSQYFSNIVSPPSQALGTSSQAMQGGSQQTPFSSPIQVSSGCLSPPVGNLGAFSFEKNTSGEEPKSPDGAFNFNFVSGPSKSSSTSFFDFKF